MKTIKRQCILTLFSLSTLFCFAGCAVEQLPDIEDGSVWVREIEPGFGNPKNYSIVAMAQYRAFFYALTRNDAQGAEVWRTDGSGTWHQVLFPGGVTNGIYGNPLINCLWGEMIVFRDKLYVGFSSGVQGSVRRSTGCEIWRYDGLNWEPVISDKVDTEEAGRITLIEGCEDLDGDTTALFYDHTKTWQPDQWAGGVLQITSGEGRFRRFDILGNTSNRLTVQQNELDSSADNGGPEYTICEPQQFKNPFPVHWFEIGRVAEGDSYEIGTGWNENGFGDHWNRMITAMVIFDDRLYVSTGLNYESGGQVWFTEDGDNWQATEPLHSFGNFHDDPNYRDGKKPVSTSITDLCVSAVSGVPVLYAGGTGSSGNKGGCARVARLTDQGWELIVDAGVDDNDTGTNENGFGDGMGCSMFNGNFMPWSLADFNDMLFVGIQSLAGTRVLFTPTGSPEDGAWFYSAGGDSPYPNGFDGKRNRGNPLFYQNIAANLFAFEGSLYAGLVTILSPTFGATQKHLTGAQLWKTCDGSVWEPVTRNGFGYKHNIAFEAFGTFNNTLYVAAGKGNIDSPDGLDPEEGGMIYRLINDPVTPEPRFSLEEIATYETTLPGDNDPADVYYPQHADGGKLPAALFLQGGRVDKSHYSRYSRRLASYGFIVIVPNHLSEFSVPGYSSEGLFSQTRQINQVLEFIEEAGADPSAALYGLIDTETLFLLGHSYGAACIIGAIQNVCEYPFCEAGEQFFLPPQVKAAALTGINTMPRGIFDRRIRETFNNRLPVAIINGYLDGNATYEVTKKSYERIQDPPKMLLFVKGANHFGMCNTDNPEGPGADSSVPTLDQEVSIETFARWSALFLRAFGLDDKDALTYITQTGRYIDPNVEQYIETDRMTYPY